MTFAVPVTVRGYELDVNGHMNLTTRKLVPNPKERFRELSESAEVLGLQGDGKLSTQPKIFRR